MMRSWSVSSIRSFHGCQLAWFFRRTNVEPEFKALALVEGTMLHAVLAFHLQGMSDGKTPTVEDALGLLDALYFMEEASGEIRYGKKDRDSILDRLRTLYRYWRDHHEPTATIVAVEEKVHVDLPGIDLPLLGYVDAVFKTPAGIEVIDFKVSAAKPWADPMLDPWDLQKLAMVHGWTAQTGQHASAFGWINLVKTKTPQVVHRSLPVAGRQREAELIRLADTVNPTLRVMEAVLEGHLAPVPTTAFGRMCQGCQFRQNCVNYAASGGTSGETPVDSSSSRRNSEASARVRSDPTASASSTS